MQYRPLGSSGIPASVVGFGAWAIGGWMWGGADEEIAIRAIHTAIDHGINLIDTAPVYGFGRSEEVVGKALQGRRDSVVLATKCGLVWNTTQGMHHFNADEDQINPQADTFKVYRYLKPASIRQEVEASLRRLQTDRIDLLQTHWQEPTTPIAETMGELLRLKQEGKIRAIGVSNATPGQMDEYRRLGALDSDQEVYNMLNRAHGADSLPYCAKHGLALLAYSPLAQGLLTGKLGPERTFSKGDQRSFKPQYTVENRQKVANLLGHLQPIAERHEITLAQLALAWAIHQKGCSHVLAGARSPEQAVENAVAGDVALTEADLQRIRAILDDVGQGIV